MSNELQSSVAQFLEIISKRNPIDMIFGMVNIVDEL